MSTRAAILPGLIPCPDLDYIEAFPPSIRISPGVTLRGLQVFIISILSSRSQEILDSIEYESETCFTMKSTSATRELFYREQTIGAFVPFYTAGCQNGTNVYTLPL